MPPWVNLANFFTLTRIVMVPFIIEAAVTGHHVWALALFMIAAETDMLDGLAARRLESTTSVGAYFDPIADKCLLSGVFLALAAAHKVPLWFVAIIFGRDLYILLGVALFLALTKVRTFPPSIWGKGSTLIQIATAFLWMASDTTTVPVWHWMAHAILWPCALVTIWSGLHYTLRGVQIARAH